MKYTVKRISNTAEAEFDNIDDAEFELYRGVEKDIKESGEMFADCIDTVDLGADWEAFKADNSIKECVVDNWIVIRK